MSEYRRGKDGNYRFLVNGVPLQLNQKILRGIGHYYFHLGDLVELGDLSSGFEY
ncbi:hypothetical protein [Mesobacillus persicus]|uniref:hypothetical protein n=1 Tax=Mesobacillus persicus TaxID=930146 RepID=UPI00147FB3F4|nr:hypothetical protein [Mesobacillus persicus]